jgi:hypothetical protein
MGLIRSINREESEPTDAGSLYTRVGRRQRNRWAAPIRDEAHGTDGRRSDPQPPAASDDEMSRLVAGTPTGPTEGRR